MSGDELRRARCVAQGLAEPIPGGSADVVRHLLAVQAQDLRAAKLAIRARSTGLSAAAVDAALERGELCVTWLMRGTLHLVCAEDVSWLLTLAAPTRMAANRRRLREEGVEDADAERAVELIGAAVAERPMTRSELVERLAAAGIRSEGQAAPHLLMLAALRGRIVRSADTWHPPLTGTEIQGTVPFFSREEALAELGRRYRVAHGPAGPEDLAAWSGLGIGDCRAALAAAGGATGPPPPPRVPPRLLAPFDCYLLGYADRSFAVASPHARLVHPGGGIIRAAATDDGIAVGTWTAPGGVARVEPFAPLDDALAAALDGEAADVDRFLA